MDRDLDWDGSFNVRDLGGLCTANGRKTRWGAVVRSARLDRITEHGWSQLWAHGVRTIIDLRNDDERVPDGVTRPTELVTVHSPLDPVDDEEFWGYWGQGLQGTPLYYQPLLDRFPRRIGKVFSALAKAEPGGVLIHCSAGRDRTGLIALVLLALVGVQARDIVEDYTMSTERLRPAFAALGMEDQGPIIENVLSSRNTTAVDILESIMDSLDAESYLRTAGLSQQELTAISDRLLD